MKAKRYGAARWLFWPVVTAASALLVYYLLFEFLVDPLTHNTQIMSRFDFQFLWEGDDAPSVAAVVAADLNARYGLAVPSVLLALASLAAMIGAFVVVLPVFGRGAIACGVVGVLVGALVGYSEQYSNPVRAGAADCAPGSGQQFCPLDQAVARSLEGWPIDQHALDHIRMIVSLNSSLSVAAIFVLGICFLFIARGAREMELSPKYLSMRRRALSAATAISAVILVCSVATTHGFYHLASSLMKPESASATSALASAGATYWGAVYTTVFIVIALPAALCLMRDAQRASEKALPDTSFSEREAWRKKHGLTVPVAEKLGATVATFAPVLTSPALDLLRSTVGAF